MFSFYDSDIVVQIVDARNPLLFRCEDLVRERERLELQLQYLKFTFGCFRKSMSLKLIPQRKT